MKPLKNLVIFSAFILLVCSACALNRNYLKTEWAEKSELTGFYTVIFYGANHYNDIATAAFLIPDDSPYKFDIYAPEFNYGVQKGVPAKEAFNMAGKFIRWHPAYIDYHFSKIFAADGKVAGYEMRPLYLSTVFGKQDVMYIDYFQRGTDIEVHVKVDPDIEKRFVTGDGDGRDD